jgi:hypothetical protein
MCLNGPCREGEEPTPAMYGGEKSDRAIVAMKPANIAPKIVGRRDPLRLRQTGITPRFLQFQFFDLTGGELSHDPASGHHSLS